MMIDTHAHIYLPEFAHDLDAVLQRAKDAGVKKIYLPNIDATTAGAMLRLSKSQEGYCLPMMGLHPCSVQQNFEAELNTAEAFLLDHTYKFAGIGECGLDYHWDKQFVAQQKEVFETQIRWAKKYKLPIIIHSREAVDDCIALIEKHKDENLRGIFHCFSGTAVQLKKIIALGFYAGIGGVVTFKNGGLDNVLTAEHLPHIVLETDAPYLAPVPFRGKRNEPSYLQYILTKLSEVIGVDEKQVADCTVRNAEQLFGLS